jgi:hypothetical protein
MNHLRSLGLCGLALAGWLTATVPARAQSDTPSPKSQAKGDKQPARSDVPKGMKVEARGPIHEAFALPRQNNPRPSPVVPKKPPKPIKEVPPDKKPEGKNVTWIPGYWSWDPDRKDFLWVSGTWRVPPKGRRWMPGYWTKADNGWRWVHGLWVSGKRKNLTYLSPPPKSLDKGPNSEAPDDNSFWVPGHWVRRGGPGSPSRTARRLGAYRMTGRGANVRAIRPASISNRRGRGGVGNRGFRRGVGRRVPGNRYAPRYRGMGTTPRFPARYYRSPAVPSRAPMYRAPAFRGGAPAFRGGGFRGGFGGGGRGGGGRGGRR